MVMQLEECAGTDGRGGGEGWGLGRGTDSVLIRLQVPPSFAWQCAAERRSPSPLMRTTRRDPRLCSDLVFGKMSNLADETTPEWRSCLSSSFHSREFGGGSYYSVPFVMFHLCIK